MKILIYEDSKWVNLTPLSLLKCVFELRCGFFSVFEKMLAILPGAEKGLWVRDYLKELAKKKYGISVNDESFFDDDILLINGRWIMTDEEKIFLEEEKTVKSGKDIIYALLKKETASNLWHGNFEEFLQSVSSNIYEQQKEAILIEYPWHFIRHNPKILTSDFKHAGKQGIKGDFSSKATIVGDEKDVFISEKTRVHPFVVIDTQTGPVYIDEGAQVFPFTRIEGPCYIGKNTDIMPGANIREGCSFGEVCKIGGEVEESIFHSYTNKYHDGFIGHSYIGEFVNLGALTTNSDLKNDYSNVSVYLNGKPVDTGELKVGSFIGDHTKTSIGTLLNTGTVVGIMGNITAENILPKYFPSFMWYVNGKFMKGYGLEMMLATAKSVMARRKRQLMPEEESVIRYVYEMTAFERKESIQKSRKQKQ